MALHPAFTRWNVIRTREVARAALRALASKPTSPTDTTVPCSAHFSAPAMRRARQTKRERAGCASSVAGSDSATPPARLERMRSARRARPARRPTPPRPTAFLDSALAVKGGGRSASKPIGAKAHPLTEHRVLRLYLGLRDACRWGPHDVPKRPDETFGSRGARWPWCVRSRDEKTRGGSCYSSAVSHARPDLGSSNVFAVTPSAE